MFLSKGLITLSLLAPLCTAGLIVANDDQDMSGLTVNGIPYSQRVKYMRLVSITILIRHA